MQHQQQRSLRDVHAQAADSTYAQTQMPKLGCMSTGLLGDPGCELGIPAQPVP
jgi:hypothetical protein